MLGTVVLLCVSSYLRHCQAQLRAPAGGTSGSPIQSQWCEVAWSTINYCWGRRSHCDGGCSLRGWGEREGVSNRSQPGLLWSVDLVGFSEGFRSVVKTESVKWARVLEHKQKEMKTNPPVTCRQYLTTTAELVCCSHTKCKRKNYEGFTSKTAAAIVIFLSLRVFP